MYSGNKYLVQRPIKYRSNNRKLSGGLPHSEIHGSKPILGSSWLIAEYHVFHRLLLPRHSPNALLALDLIQKKTGLCHSEPKASLFPLLYKCIRTLVSVLDLNNFMPRGKPQISAHCQNQHETDVYLSKRCHGIGFSTRKPQPRPNGRQNGI